MTAERRAYYVTAIRDHRIGWLYGPIMDHALAIEFVPYIRAQAIAFDPFMHFDMFGTAALVRSSEDIRPFLSGQFNHLAGRY